MAAHLKKYTQNETKSLLLYRQVCKNPEIQEQYTLFHESPEEKGNLETRHSFISPFKAQKGYFRVVGSVHGLICLSDDLFGYTYLVLLWNPLVHKYIKLPIPTVTYHVNGAYISILGSGYDSRKCDHKVVRVVYVRDKVGLDTTPPLVELYSVHDGFWRSVSSDCLVDHCICDRWWSQCFLNGSIHWVGWRRNGVTSVFESNCLLLFDIKGEKFTRMKLPEALVKVCTLDLRVSEYRGRLSVLHAVMSGGIIEGVITRCEIWVKTEYNVGSSWSRTVSIEVDANMDLGWVQCLRKNGEVLAFTKGGRELVSYDLDTKQTKKLGFHGCWLTWFTGTYTESLILLDKKSGVQTYGEAGKCRKSFIYRFLRDGNHSLEEVEADKSCEDENGDRGPYGLSTGDDKIFYKPDKFLLMEQFMKFDRFRDFESLLSIAGAYGFC